MNNTTREELPHVENLWHGCEGNESRDIDWSAGYGENWTSYESHEVECEESTVYDEEKGKDVPCTFKGAAVMWNGCWTCPVCDTEHDTESYDDGPMMSYYYPLPDGDVSSEDALKLAHLPLCLVNFHGSDNEDRPEWALALTGGGMDLSWQIAEAHMQLGYMPPAFVCNLPRMAGMDLDSPVNAWIVAGCKRTGEALMLQGQRIISRLEDMGSKS